MKVLILLLLLSLLSITTVESKGRKFYSRRRNTGARPSVMRKPITGKYKNPDSHKYYNNASGAKIVKSSHFQYRYVLGHKIAFLCVAQGNPRPHITWYKDGLELYMHSFLQIHEWKTGKNKLKSKMEIDPATQMDAGIYSCAADNKYAIDRRAFRTDFTIDFD